MAATRLRTICTKCFLNGSYSRILSTQTAKYSQWPQEYLEPTFKKVDLEQELPWDDPRRFSQIKAATPDQTCSLIYDDTIDRLVKHILKEGNKDRARYIVDKTFEEIKKVQLERYYKAKTDEDRQSIELNPTAIVNKAVKNATPLLIIKTIRKGAVMYEVPCAAGIKYREFKAIRWLVDSASEGKHRSVRVWVKLAQEVIDAANNDGKAVRKKQDLHRTCEANRAYAHFRWS